jgi:hypothetical protein
VPFAHSIILTPKGHFPLLHASFDRLSLIAKGLNAMQPNNAEPISASDVAVLDSPVKPTPENAEETVLTNDTVSPIFPDHRQAGASRWLWLGLLLSIGLHIGLMLIPSGHEPPPPPKTEPEKQVRITQLAKLKTVKLPNKVVKPLARVVRPRSAPLIVQPQPPIPPKALPSLGDPPEQGDAAESSSWEDFPLYPGAQPGCFGLPSCLQTADSLKQVADYYAKELPAKKYALTPKSQEAGRQVFQVSRKGEAQFLSIIQTDKGQAIVLSDAPRSLDDLKKAVEVPPEVAAILSSLAAENAKPADFAQADVAYTKSAEKGYASGAAIPKPEVVNISLVRSYSFDTMMSEFFRSNLVNAGFDVTDLPDFGGGKLYTVSKESSTLFLSLLPSQDGDNTLIVTWKTQPK